jgi:DNA-directed RNA polymerase specialized sigma24 family protein
LSSSDDSVAGKGGQFMTTSWSAVFLSAQSQAPGSDRAREEFCQLYWYPLYAFIRRRGYNEDDAKDLTQGFFLFILDRKALQRATPAKGKFRSFLLGSLKNYLSNVYQHENAIKRGGKIDFVSVDFSDGEDRYSREPADLLTPEKVFDANWAVTLLGQKRYSEILRAAVAQTVTDPSEIDAEIRSLCEALIASEGRLRP